MSNANTNNPVATSVGAVSETPSAVSVGSGGLVRGARAARVKRLVGHGFVQGSRAEQNAGECHTCGKSVKYSRLWAIGGGGEYNDNWDIYCFRCAEKRMLADEEEWAWYADPKNQAKLEAEFERMVEDHNASTPNVGSEPRARTEK